jgi:hypothetical protein
MNPTEDGLAKLMRALADTSPQGAPPELYVRLSEQFQRHHRRVRRKRAIIVGGLVASLLIAAVWRAFPHAEHSVSVATNPPNVIRHPLTGTLKQPNVRPKNPKVALQRPVKPRLKITRARSIPSPRIIADRDFIALPSYDPAIPIDQVRIVHLETTGSALQLVGYPVDGEFLQRRVLADVLVGQDGQPFAIRIIETQSNTVEH